MTRIRTLLVVSLCVAALFAVPVPVAAADVDGTVTVANGSADGDRVTVTPLDSNFRRAGPQVNTTVDGSTFTATGVTDAPVYFVRVVHEDTAHFALLRNETHAELTLTGELSGRIVDENGTGQEGVRMGLFSSYGPMVAGIETGENGTFTADPLKPNTTYYLQYSVDGIPYNRTVETGDGPTRIVAREPTADPSVLTATGRTPASHVIQVIPPRNGSRPTVVENVSLRNRGDRPFVGAVELQVPHDTRASAAMYEGKRIPVTQRGRTVSINATIPSGAAVQVGVAYPLEGRTLDRTLRYSPDTAAVVLRGYDVSRVQHSDNLVRADSPVPLLVARNVSGRNTTLSVTLPAEGGGAGTSDSGGTPGGVGAGEAFGAPALPLFLGLLGAIGGGLLAHRAL
jgi:hypothetical protein